MRRSSSRTSLIFLASAALGIAACGSDTSTNPGGTSAAAGAATSTTTGSSTLATAGSTATSTATGAAGHSAAAAGSHATTTTTTTASAGSPATATGAAGTAATTGAAGATATAGAGAAGVAAAMGAAGAAGGGSPGAPTFTRVFDEVLNAGCAAGAVCHGADTGPAKLGFSDKMTAFMELVGVMPMGMIPPGQMGTGCAGMNIVRVKAGDPDNSLLMQKLEGKQTCGNQMPPGGMIKPDQIQLVHDWIMAGAKND